MLVLKPSKDSKTFDELYLANFERLCKYSVSILGDEDSAKDIVNDVFVRILGLWDSIDFTKVENYLYQSVHNQSIDYLRRQYRNAEYTEEMLKVMDDLYQDELEMRERDRIVAQMMEQLPEKSSFVLKEYFLEQKQQAEIAAELGVTPDAIKKQVAKALKLLRELCAKHYND